METKFSAHKGNKLSWLKACNLKAGWICSRESFCSSKSSNGLFWKNMYIQGIINCFFRVDFPIGGGEYANSFMPEMGKCCHLKSRGHPQTAHTVCMLCWSLVPKDCFFPLAAGDSGYTETGRIAIVDTQYISRTKATPCFFVFQASELPEQLMIHKPYMKLFSFLLALCKDKCVFWCNNTSDSDLERDQFAACMVSNGLSRKLWPFAPCTEDLSSQFASCWLGQGHSP